MTSYYGDPSSTINSRRSGAGTGSSHQDGSSFEVVEGGTGGVGGGFVAGRLVVGRNDQDDPDNPSESSLITISRDEALYQALLGNKSLSLIRSLLDNGCNPTRFLSNGENCLTYAVRYCPERLDVILCMVKAVHRLRELAATFPQPPPTGDDGRSPKISVDCRDNFGRTPLHYAAEQGVPELVSMLLGSGAGIDKTDTEGVTALHLATSRNHPATVRTLIAFGAKLNLKTHACYDKISALHIATGRGLEEIVKILVEAGANLDSLDSKEQTPLFLAASRDNWNIAYLLLSNGAQPNICQINGYTALSEAVQEGNEKMTRLLLDFGALPRLHPYLLHRSIVQNHHKGTSSGAGAGAGGSGEGVSRALIEHCMVNVDECWRFASTEMGEGSSIGDGGGWKPLHLAAKLAKPSIMRSLLDHGADPNGTVYDEEQRETPLMSLIRFNLSNSQVGGSELPSALVNNNGSQSLLDSPMHLTGNGPGEWSRTDFVDCLSTLAKYGVDLNNRGIVMGIVHTPLTLALAQHKLWIVRDLIEYGCDPMDPYHRLLPSLASYFAIFGPTCVHLLVEAGLRLPMDYVSRWKQLLNNGENHHRSNSTMSVSELGQHQQGLHVMNGNEDGRRDNNDGRRQQQQEEGGGGGGGSQQQQQQNEVLTRFVELIRGHGENPRPLRSIARLCIRHALKRAQQNAKSILLKSSTASSSSATTGPHHYGLHNIHGGLHQQQPQQHSAPEGSFLLINNSHHGTVQQQDSSRSSSSNSHYYNFAMDQTTTSVRSSPTATSHHNHQHTQQHSTKPTTVLAAIPTAASYSRKPTADFAAAAMDSSPSSATLFSFPAASSYSVTAANASSPTTAAVPLLPAAVNVWCNANLTDSITVHLPLPEHLKNYLRFKTL